jgi:hypothetical protein
MTHSRSTPRSGPESPRSHRIAALTAAGCVSLVAVAGAQGPGDLQRVEQDLRAILDAQDRAFAAEDLDAYFASFRPLHMPTFAHAARVLERSFTRPGSTRRATTIVHVDRRGDRAIAFVRAEYRVDGARPLTQAYALILGRGENGRLAILTQVPCDERMVHEYGSPDFECRACNYRVEAPRDAWVLVPQPARLFGALESVAYYSLHHDLSIQVAIHTDGVAGRSANELLTAWLEKMESNPSPFAKRTPVRAWMPASVAGQRHVSGARVEVVYRESGRVSRFHVLAHGGMHYLFDVEGSAEAVERAGDDAETVLASFAFLDPALDPDLTAVRAKDLLLKGTLEGRTFRNDRLGVRFEAPAGWIGEQPGSACDFEVVFRAPNGNAQIRLRGLPLGSKAAVDSMVTSLLEQQDASAQRLEDEEWRAARAGDPGYSEEAPPAEGDEVRRIGGSCRFGAFTLWLVLRDDRDGVVLVEARGDDAEERASAMAAASGLRLR